MVLTLKREKVKKYFMKESGEEIQFGERIVLDFTKEDDEKITHHHMDCTFIPELVNMLIENDVIEESEENCPCDLEERVDNLEEEVKKLKKAVVLLTKDEGK